MGRLRTGALGRLLWLRALRLQTGRRTTDRKITNARPDDINQIGILASKGITRAALTSWLPMAAALNTAALECAAELSFKDRAYTDAHDDQQRFAQGAPDFFPR